MTVRYGNAQALCGEVRALRGNYLAALYLAPYLERLSLGLLFLAANVGDDVVYHLGPCLKSLARAGDRLICADENILDSELGKREQRRNVALERAVGFDRDEAALGTQTLALGGNDLDMVGVDLGHHHGNIRGETMGTVVGDHRALSLGVCFLQCFDLVLGHIDSAENKIHLRSNFLYLGSVQNGHLLHALRHGSSHGPARAHCILIAFARTAAGCSQHGQLEPGMILQQSHKTLTHHASCAYDTHFILFFHFQHLSFRESELNKYFYYIDSRLANRTAMQYNRYCLYRFYDIIDTVSVSIIGKANCTLC